MKAIHVFIAIIISWLIVLAPYFVPALNVSTRIIGIPVTVWVSIVAFALCLVVNELAFHKTWEIFDDEDEDAEKEGD